MSEPMTRLQPSTSTNSSILKGAEIMAGGNWMPELIALAGGINLFGAAGKQHARPQKR